MGKKTENNSLFYFPGNLVATFKIRRRILGKVDLQKTVYFMKRLGVPIPFEFRWNILGPYSYDLKHHCDHLSVEDFFQYSGEYILNEKKAKTYPSNLKTEVRDRIEKFFGRIDEICERHQFDRVSLIECAASLDFINENAPEGIARANERKTVIYSLLNHLKPEKAELFSTLREDAWNLLDDEGLI